MTEERLEVRQDGLARLQSAAADFARAEIVRIVQVVIDYLRSRSALGTFEDIAARHLWDEFCWALQEGPFDDEIRWDDVSLGSLSGAFDEAVRGPILVEVDNLPRHTQIFLSALATEKDANSDEDEALGSVWVHGVVELILDEISLVASRRSLDLIGPHRGDVIGYEAEGSGVVWSVLSDRDEATELLAEHTDAMIHPDGDLSQLAEDMVEAFMTAANEDAAGTVFVEFLDHFEDDLRSLIRERDILPALEQMRASLLEQLDR